MRDRLALRHVALGTAFLAALLLVLAACDGGSNEPRSVEALPTATLEPEPAGVGALPLERFSYEASLTLREGGGEDAAELLITTSGIFVAPDRHAFTYRTQLGEGQAEQQVVIIGDDAWHREGEREWREVGIEDERVVDLLNVAFSAVRPDFLGGDEFQRVRANVASLPSTEEFVNEIRAYHYQVGVEGRQYLEALQVGEEGLRAANDLEWHLWLARDGDWPVRLLATGTVVVDLTVLETLELRAPTQWEIRIDVSRPNDPELVITAPDAG